MDSRGYGSGAGGKIRRHRPSRAVAASPYARPAPSSAPSSLAPSQGGGWFSRIITAGASRLLPALFRKPPPQLTVPASLPPELLEEPPSRDPLLGSRLDWLEAPPSPLPPPLEDDLPDDEESGGVAANNLCIENPQSSAKEKEEDILRNSDGHGSMDLEDLLKQRSFTRSESEYLAELLWSRTIGSSSQKPEDGSIRKSHVYEKENGSIHSKLPVDFSITTNSVADQVASPAEIGKAYMGSKSSKGSPLRLRLHDPSSMPIKSREANTVQIAKPPTFPLLQGSRLHTSKTSDCFESNYTTPNRSAICKMSSSPYFKSGLSSKELSGTVTSPYRTPSSVHTFGRQVLKRKSSAVDDEIVSIGPICRMHQRYNRTSPQLETRSGYHRYLGGYGVKLDGYPEQLAHQKRRCLDKIGNGTLGSLNDRAHATNFGQAPVQSADMAAKILKQLDTLVPSQKENMPEIKEKHGNAMDLEDLVSQQKEVSADSNLLEPSPSEVKEYSLHDGITSTKSIPQITSNKKKAPTFSSRSKSPNPVLSDEFDSQKMSTPSNDFTFPVSTVTIAQSQVPPTPTMLPPVLLAEQQQPSTFVNASIPSAEIGTRISKSVSGGPILQKFDSKLNADDQSMPCKISGQDASFTSNLVFKVANSKITSLNNGHVHMPNSTLLAIQPSNGSTNSSSLQISGSSTITNSALKSTQSSSTGGSFSFSAPSSRAESPHVSQSFVDSPIGPAVGYSPSYSSSSFSSLTCSGPTSAAGTAPPSSATVSSLALGASPVFSAQPAPCGKLTTAAPLLFGLPNTGSATSPFSSTPDAVFSFTPATLSVPYLSPTTLFGSTAQMNGGSKTGFHSPKASPFGLPSNSLPATQVASTTAASPGVFQFGQQSQASAGGFSIGTGVGNDKSGRRTIRVKRRK